MTDTPALCIPPDSSVSGWWHVITNEQSNDGHEVAEWMTYGDYCTPHWRSRGTVLSILGPVATHAEVETLRAEIQRLRDALGTAQTDLAAQRERHAFIAENVEFPSTLPSYPAGAFETACDLIAREIRNSTP